MRCIENGSTGVVNLAPLAGDVVAQKYRITDLLACGGMGTIYAAEHLTLGMQVALKWVRKGRGEAPASAEREAFAAARARHPNVVEVFESVRDGGEAFVVMELLRGQTLAQHFAQSIPTVEGLVALLLPAMRAVDRAHRRGVIHLDITPSNLFVCQRAPDPPAIKIIDFGLAELTNQPQQSLDTSSRRVSGTPMYMSHEQLMNRPDIDARADVYSFGAVLYEGLAGRAPFDAATVSEIILKAFSVPAPPLREFNPYVSIELEELVKSAMNKDRDRRPPSMRALIRRLERIPLRSGSGEIARNRRMTEDGADSMQLAGGRATQETAFSISGQYECGEVVSASRRGATA